MDGGSGIGWHYPVHPSLSRKVLWIASIALIYFLTARLSLLLLFQPEDIAAIWPPAGIFLSAILLTRRELRPYLVGTLFIVDLIAEMIAGTPFLVSAAYAFALAGDAAVGSWLLIRFVGEPLAFRRVQEVFGFIFFAVVLSNAMMSLVAAAAAQSLPGTTFWKSWKLWAASEGIGNLLLTPCILSWASLTTTKPGRWKIMRILEGFALIASFITLNIVGFVYLLRVGHFSLLLTYLTASFLLWAAFRFGVRGVTSTAIVLAVIAIYFTASGHISSTPLHDSPMNAVIVVQLYLALMAVPTLILGAVMTEHKWAEVKIRRVNRALQVLSECNQKLIRATNEAELLDDVCRITVDIGGYRLAWVGYAEHDEAKTVRPVAQAGFEEGYLETLHVTWADTERGHGPGGAPIRIGQPFLTRNILTDPDFVPWRAEALKRGYASALGLPLIAEGQTLGVLAVYSSQQDAFDAEEEKLLMELAGDLAYGITMLRRRAAHLRDQDALRESEDRFRTMANAIPQLAWIARPDGHIDWFNQRWYDYTGTTPEQMAGGGWQSVHDPAVLPEVMEQWTRSLATGRPLDMTFPLRRADGAFRPFLTRVLPVRDERGQVIQWFGTNTDVTEQKQAEEALREADRRKNEFLAMLAHELRNPLAPVRNAVQIMQILGLQDPVILRQRDIINRQVTHMAHLVDDLLDISRITRGRIELKKKKLNLADILAQAVEIAAPLVETRRHTFSQVMPPEAICLEADPDRLTQIMGNLLSNAAKYTPEGGQIWLEARREGAEAVIRVRDTGVGIAPEMLPHIFELFIQADQGLARSQGGLGIGLTMVKSLVEMHGGSVLAHSEGLGRGSEFTVRLPALPEESAASSRPEESIERLTESSPRRILVVDDVVDSAESLAEIFSLWGHEARTAYSGPAALALAREFRPEIVLLDLGMSDMDGYEVARRLRQEPALSGIWLVAITGYGQEADRRRAEEAGFDRYFTKPVELKELQTLLASVA